MLGENTEHFVFFGCHACDKTIRWTVLSSITFIKLSVVLAK